MGSPQLQAEPLRVHRAVRLVDKETVLALLLLAVFFGAGCTTLPEPKFSKYAFPQKDAYIDPITREHEKIGTVRAKVNFPTLDPNRDEEALCRNYFNKAVQDLVRMARKKGADAVIDVRSVVFYEGGKTDLFTNAECSDDGEEGQALAQGVAVKWKAPEEPTEKPNNAKTSE